jgi:hypothetical protein
VRSGSPLDPQFRGALAAIGCTDFDQRRSRRYDDSLTLTSRASHGRTREADFDEQPIRR